MWMVSSRDPELHELFRHALHIKEPWELVAIDFDKVNQHWILHVDFERGASFACPNCGAPSKAYDVQHHTWRHLDFWHWKTYISARVPRVECKQCNKITKVPVSWSRPLSRFTLHFESYAMRLMAEMPVNAASRELREHDTRLWRIFRYYVQEAMNQLDISKVKRVAVDETSSRRGHRYITLFVDVDAKLVLFAVEGKGTDTIQKFKEYLAEKGVPAEQIQEMCCDMSPAFIKGIQETFPNAHITFDKFHVIKMINDAVDDVRREEQKHEPELKRTRYIWLKNEDNLKSEQKEKLARMKDSHLKTGRAYRLKLALQDLWRMPHLLADVYLEEWIGWAKRSQLPPIVDVAKTIKQHQEGILRWFYSKMTNGLLEGVNSLVQAAKRRARGYRNTENLISMVYMTANKLRLNTLTRPQRITVPSA